MMTSLTCVRRNLIPLTTVEPAPRSLFSNVHHMDRLTLQRLEQSTAMTVDLAGRHRTPVAPLLEVEGNPMRPALIAQRLKPLRVAGSGVMAALSAGDDPVNRPAGSASLHPRRKVYRT